MDTFTPTDATLRFVFSEIARGYNVVPTWLATTIAIPAFRQEIEVPIGQNYRAEAYGYERLIEYLISVFRYNPNGMILPPFDNQNVLIFVVPIDSVEPVSYKRDRWTIKYRHGKEIINSTCDGYSPAEAVMFDFSISKRSNTIWDRINNLQPWEGGSFPWPCIAVAWDGEPISPDG